MRFTLIYRVEIRTSVGVNQITFIGRRPIKDDVLAVLMANRKEWEEMIQLIVAGKFTVTEQPVVSLED